MKKLIFRLFTILLLIHLWNLINPRVFAAINKSSANNLVKLETLDKSFIIDLKYATKDNFTKRVLYEDSIAILNLSTAKKLINANNYLKKFGYHIKIYDAYRPYSIQKLMWKYCPNKNYLASPSKGSNHNRGTAVDIALVDRNGKEVIMPSRFDEFSVRSHIDYKNTSKKALANRELLAKAMLRYGFKRIHSEWWHFDDTDSRKFCIQDIPLKHFK